MHCSQCYNSGTLAQETESLMYTIGLIAQKGGVGKSTLACAMASAAVERGHTACILDLDPQKSLANWGQVREQAGREEPLIYPVDPRKLAAAFKAARDLGVNFLVIDTPPHTQTSVLAAGVRADLVCVPTRAAFFDAVAIARTIDACREVGVKAPVIVVVNQAPPVGGLAERFREQLAARGIDVCPQVIARRVDHEYAVMKGLTAIEYNPSGKAALESLALFDALHKRLKAHRRKARRRAA